MNRNTAWNLNIVAVQACCWYPLFGYPASLQSFMVRYWVIITGPAIRAHSAAAEVAELAELAELA